MGHRNLLLLLLLSFLALVHFPRSHAERYLQRYFTYDSVRFQNVSSYFDAINALVDSDSGRSRIQSNVSFNDDTPMDHVKLQFAFPFLSASYTDLYISPNGGISMEATAPCSCCFMGSDCNLKNSYQHWIAAYVADFNPAELLKITSYEMWLQAQTSISTTTATVNPNLTTMLPTDARSFTTPPEHTSH